MNLPKDYDNATAFNGGIGMDPLPVGPHCCRIIGARVMTSSVGSEMLEVAFDIYEGGDFDGRFGERFQELRAKNPSAKWPSKGIFRTGILTKEGKTNGYFKGVITAVEESNAGYNFKATNCNEATLKDKMIAFNFGEREFLGNDSNIHISVEPFYAISVATARAGIAPPKRKPYRFADGTPAGFTDVTEAEQPDLPF